MPPFSQVAVAPVEAAPVEADRARPGGVRLCCTHSGGTGDRRDPRGGGPGVRSRGPVPVGPRAGQLPSASPQTVSTMMAVTSYGSMLAFGRRSSSQPVSYTHLRAHETDSYL